MCRVQVGGDDGVHDGALGARSQKGFAAHGLMTRWDNSADLVHEAKNVLYTVMKRLCIRLVLII